MLVGVGRIFSGVGNGGFFPGGGQTHFSKRGGANSGELSFSQLETKWKIFFYWKVNIRKYQILKCNGQNFYNKKASINLLFSLLK